MGEQGLFNGDVVLDGLRVEIPKFEFATDSPLEGGVSCELVSKSPIPCNPGKYSELHSAAECSAG